MIVIDKELFRDELFRHYELLKVDDYEVWAVVDVDEVLDNIEEVEAIPIEWIERFMSQFELYGSTTEEYHLLHYMLTLWEDEHGKE